MSGTPPSVPVAPMADGRSSGVHSGRRYTGLKEIHAPLLVVLATLSAAVLGGFSAPHVQWAVAIQPDAGASTLDAAHGDGALAVSSSARAVSEPPQVMHTPPSGAITGEPITIWVSISDPPSVDHVKLRYMGVEDDRLRYRGFLHVRESLYRAEIPAQRLPGVVSYAIVVDLWDGSSIRVPEQGFYTLEVSWGLPVPIILSMATVSLGLVAAVVGAYLLSRRAALAEARGSPGE